MRRALPRTAILFLVLALAGPVFAGPEPPEGPPWTRDFAAAQKEALKRSVPIFVYFTKTY